MEEQCEVSVDHRLYVLLIYCIFMGLVYKFDFTLLVYLIFLYCLLGDIFSIYLFHFMFIWLFDYHLSVWGYLLQLMVYLYWWIRGWIFLTLCYC